MSSKPRTGINHKEFGVTSEGVNVYLDVALREILHIDPVNESFTVKMTGGPDGDVGKLTEKCNGNVINYISSMYMDSIYINKRR